METFLEILKEINIAQTIIIFAGLWFFYNRLDNKIDKVEKRLNDRIDSVEKKLIALEDKLTNRIDNLYSLFTGFLCNKRDDNAA